MEFQKNVSLKNYTTFKIGGKAKYFYVAKTKKDLISAIKTAKELKLPFFVLGGGSNLLVSDKGFKGLIIKFQNPNSKIQIKSKFQNPKIYVEAGTILGKAVNVAAEAGLTGLEWAAGIPGTVGGAVYGNAGLPNESMGDIIEEVEVFDFRDFKIKKFENKNCKFSYRDSIFKHKKNLIILFVTLQLKKGNKNKITEKIKKYLEYKKNMQPLNFPSAGSIFKNPEGFSVGELGKENKSSSSSTELPKEVKVRKRIKFSCDFAAARMGKENKSSSSSFAAARMGKEDKSSSSSFAAARMGKEDKSSSSSFAAARMIEECGLKGKKIGNAKISEKHANFIVNLGGAESEDVKKLINLIKKSVKNKFGVVLEEEIQYLS